MMILLSGISFAAGLTVQAYGNVLTAPDNRWFDGGIGAPTVDYDPVNNQWVMLFEGYGTAAMGGCKAVWSIGRATSPDGIDWVVDPEPVIVPDYTESEVHCRSVQPALAWDGSVWHVVYATGYEVNSTRNPWAGSFVHATSADGITWTTVDEPLTQEPSSNSWAGLPSLAVADDGLFLAYNTYDDIGLLHEPAESVDDWADPVPLSAEDSWGTALAPLSPSLTCDPTGAHALLMYSLATRTDRMLRRASSDDGVDWVTDGESWLDFGSFAPGELRHVEVLRIADTDEDVVLYYSTGDGTIGAASTLPTWSGTASRSCIPASEGPPVSPTPLQELSAVATHAVEGAPEACGCASARGGGLVGLVALLALRRRR